MGQPLPELLLALTLVAIIQELYRVSMELRVEADGLRRRVQALQARLGSGGEH